MGKLGKLAFLLTRFALNEKLAIERQFLNIKVNDLGRAGVKGTAYTLVTDKDKEFVGHIVRNLEAANQDVTKELMDLVSSIRYFPTQI